MKNENFTYSLKSSKSPEEVFELLLNIKAWWSGLYGETIKGDSRKVNDEFSFRAGGGAHYSKQKLIEFVPSKKVVWLVTDSKLNFLKNAGEWTDTRICFEISPEDKETKVTFTHDGLVPEIECYKECSSGWTNYLEKLKNRL